MQVKALVAAAGSNFNKQIKDLRLQVKGLKETPMSLSENLEERALASILSIISMFYYYVLYIWAHINVIQHDTYVTYVYIRYISYDLT